MSSGGVNKGITLPFKVIKYDLSEKTGYWSNVIGSLPKTLISDALTSNNNNGNFNNIATTNTNTQDNDYNNVNGMNPNVNMFMTSKFIHNNHAKYLTDMKQSENKNNNQQNNNQNKNRP
eukprot:UN03360